MFLQSTLREYEEGGRDSRNKRRQQRALLIPGFNLAAHLMTVHDSNMRGGPAPSTSSEHFLPQGASTSTALFVMRPWAVPTLTFCLVCLSLPRNISHFGQ